MATDEARVLGGSGPAVLLVPGGAETSDGFFPGLPEGLVVDPGCRVVLYDRPGAPLVSWPGATHNLQLDHPDETLTTVRELVARVGSR